MADHRSVLSRREADVMSLLALGLRDREIGAQLGITEETVGAHVRRIFAKLDVHDRSAARASALRLGIVHLD